MYVWVRICTDAPSVPASRHSMQSSVSFEGGLFKFRLCQLGFFLRPWAGLRILELFLLHIC